MLKHRYPGFSHTRRAGGKLSSENQRSSEILGVKMLVMSVNSRPCTEGLKSTTYCYCTGLDVRQEVEIPRIYRACSKALESAHFSWFMLPFSCSTDSYSFLSSHSASSRSIAAI